MGNIHPYFLIFEGLMYGLLVWNLWDVHHRQGWHGVWQVLAGVIFGVLLEWATIQQLHAYRYGRFAVMIADEVPLAIGVGWGVIIYAARQYVEATTLPRWAWPVAAGLLALNIDLSMDAIAIRLGMWDWGQGMAFQYFGVPWANFWAWFWVVCSFTAGMWLFAQKPHPLSRWLGPVTAVILGVLGVLATNAFIVFVVPRAWYGWTIGVTLFTALGLVMAQRPRLSRRPASPLVRWTPAVFHGYFLIAGLVSGVIFHPPVLLGVSLLTALLAWGVYERGRVLDRVEKI